MKKQFALSVFGILCFGCLCAQSLSPSDVVPNGAVSETSEVSLEWTIGEVFPHTVFHENGIITQGFQQPILQVDLVETGNAAPSSGLDIKIYPNPVKAILTIKFTSEKDMELDFALNDLTGKNLLLNTENTAPGELELDMGYLPAGFYFLLIKENDGATVQSYKVTKVTY